MTNGINLKNAKSEVEKLEIVYHDVVRLSYEAFKDFFSAWIYSGIALAMMFFGTLRGLFVPSTVMYLYHFVTGRNSFILFIYIPSIQGLH